MSAPAPQCQPWSRGKFLLVAAGLFAGQAGLLFLVAERPRPWPVTVERDIFFRALPAPLSGEDLAKHVFAIDPTVFPSSAPAGFADQAWLRLPANEHQMPKRPETASFLEFAANPLGGPPRPSEEDRPQIPTAPASQEGAFMAPAAAPTATEAGRQESFFRIEGELAGSQIAPPPQLNDWTNATLLTNTVVQFAINRAGLVNLAQVMTGSGLDSADLRAVAVVSGLRFRPGGKRTAELAWDKATFYWRTTQPAGTNAVVEAGPADAR